jgi:hypothetical protein
VQRAAISAGIVALVFALLTLVGLSAPQYVAAASISSAAFIALISAVPIMAWLRARWAGRPMTGRLARWPIVGRAVRRVTRPFRGKGRLVDALAADPVARLSAAQFLILTGILYVSAFAILFGYGDAETRSFQIVLVPKPEIVLRSYNDEIVTAPIDFATTTVTMKYSKRRLTTDEKSLALYNMVSGQPISRYVVDPDLDALLRAARRERKTPPPAHRH